MDIVARSETAGVAGAGVAGRPFHDRLTRRLEVVIADGVECEPLLAADRAILVRYPEQVLKGLTLALEATGAARGLIAVRGTDLEVMAALAQARRRFAHVKVVPLEDYYPAGDPAELIREVLGMQIPPGVQPEDSGVMVAGVDTLWHLEAAARGRPVTHRFVTVAGEIHRPQTLRVPIGLPIEDLVALCGGPARASVATIADGPVRGRRVGPGATVSKATRAVLVLPEDHPVAVRCELPVETLLRRASSSCAACRMCTDRCPRHLLGYGIEPHLLMRALGHRLDTIPEVVTGAGACNGCHVCEAVCPANLSPGRLYGAIADDLRARGLSELPRKVARASREAAAGRRVPRAWLQARLGLTPYAACLPVDDNYHGVSRVLLELDGGEPVVAVGQRVEPGDLVATPRGPGTRTHSPIEGVVHRVDPALAPDARIEIRMA